MLIPLVIVAAALLGHTFWQEILDQRGATNHQEVIYSYFYPKLTFTHTHLRNVSRCDFLCRFLISTSWSPPTPPFLIFKPKSPLAEDRQTASVSSERFVHKRSELTRRLVHFFASSACWAVWGTLLGSMSVLVNSGWSSWRGVSAPCLQHQASVSHVEPAAVQRVRRDLQSGPVGMEGARV